MTGRYFGHIQHIIQQAEQMVAGLLHVVEIFGCWAESGVLCSSVAMPSTPFRGVRISWLMRARKVSLARASSSTSRLACFRAR